MELVCMTPPPPAPEEGTHRRNGAPDWGGGGGKQGAIYELEHLGDVKAIVERLYGRISSPDEAVR
jgi:hypothetical protein